MLVKHCAKCRLDKPLHDFSADKKTRDKLKAWCKGCQRAYWAEYSRRPGWAEHKSAYNAAYKSVPEHKALALEKQRTPQYVEGARAGSKKYANTAKGKEHRLKNRRKNQSSSEYRRLNPNKARCHAIVATLNEKQPCEMCGRSAVAHHSDYSKPLDIRWFCRTHHAAWHRLFLAENA